jgi:copper transport protein
MRDEQISRGEAVRRTAGIAVLCGLAVAWLVALPYARVQGPQIAALLGAAIAGALRLAVALAVAGRGGGRAAWRCTVALGAVTTMGWIVTRATPVPGVAEDAGRWTSPVGLAVMGLATVVAALGLAGAGVPPSPARRLRAAGGAAAVAVALTPGAAMLLVALGPVPGHHHGSAAASIGPHRFHTGSAVTPPRAFRPGFGGHAGHYVYANATPPHLPPWALGLALGAAAMFVSTAAGALRRRVVAASAPGVDAAAAPTASAPAPPEAAEPTAGRAAPGDSHPARPAARRRAARARRRLLTLGALCGLAVALPAESASAHATLVRANPPALARIAAAPERVTLAFSEPVQVVRPGDVVLLDHAGRRLRTGAAQAGHGDRRVVTLALRGAVAPDSYTIRYRVISADAHPAAGALVFAVGGAPLLPPAGRAVAGPSETGLLAVDARFAELVALGLLLALTAFRALVWGPAVGRAGLDDTARAAAASAGRRAYWRALWGMVAVAGVAEAAVVVVKASLVFGSSPWAALTTPSAAERLLAASRFGDLLGARGGLLCAIAAVAVWAWQAEAAGAPDAGGPGGRPAHAAALAALSAETLGLVAAQGHASQAPLPALSVAFDAVHLGAAAVWLGGLACLAFVLRAAPRRLPDGGAVASAALRRFSRVALVAVGAVAVTGVVRAVGELGAPAQLFATAYGRSLLAKSLLLAPVALLALRNRRAVAALARAGRPSAAALRAVWRDVRAELAVGMMIVLVAAVLVAQVPGRA